MFNNNSNKTLWIVSAILLVAVILIFTTESTKKERSFRKELVSIDTMLVSQISLFPKSQKGKEIILKKTNNDWEVTADGRKKYLVPKSKIDNLLNQLLAIQPKRIAARSKDKWGEYQIDSASTRVVVKQGSDEVLDLLIGKFAFQQPRSMSTFVKLVSDTDVYEVDGFLEMTFNKDINSFRNEVVVKSDKSKWNKLKFESENIEESFEMVKMNNDWFVDGIKTDSVKTDQALNSLSNLSNSVFVDIDKAIFPKQTAKLIIQLESEDPIVLTAFQDSTNYIIQSSLNSESSFDGKSVGEKIFFNKSSLFSE